MNNNLNPFLDMLGHSEGTTIIPTSDGGYNVLVGSTPEHPIFFTDYSTHPNIFDKELDSTAAGKYQINHPTYLDYCQEVAPINFGHEAQDLIAEWLIGKCSATDDINSGNFASAVQKCSDRWASLPGGNSGQHENSLNSLQQIYLVFGGTLAG